LACFGRSRAVSGSSLWLCALHGLAFVWTASLFCSVAHSWVASCFGSQHGGRLPGTGRCHDVASDGHGRWAFSPRLVCRVSFSSAVPSALLHVPSLPASFSCVVPSLLACSLLAHVLEIAVFLVCAQATKRTLSRRPSTVRFPVPALCTQRGLQQKHSPAMCCSLCGQLRFAGLRSTLLIQHCPVCSLTPSRRVDALCGDRDRSRVLPQQPRCSSWNSTLNRCSLRCALFMPE
jgi:hypothetical protein